MNNEYEINKFIDLKLLELEKDEEKRDVWLNRDEADKMMTIRNNN